MLQNLLRERVSIRDGVSILEALAEAGATTKNATLLTEFVRQGIARTLVKPYLNDKGELPAFFMDPAVEQTIQAGVEHTEATTRLALAPATIGEILQKVRQTVGQLQGPTLLICSSAIRFSLRQIVENEVPLLAVLSHGEMPPQVKIVSLGIVR